MEDAVLRALTAIDPAGRVPIEGLRAMAIALRTMMPGAPQREGMTWGGRVRASPRAAAAAQMTQGFVLAWGGALIRARLVSSNGGHTLADGGLPYYRVRADPWDDAGRRAEAAQGRAVRIVRGPGLSIIGAAYAAHMGEDAADILAFYFPGAQIVWRGEGGEASRWKGWGDDGQDRCV